MRKSARLMKRGGKREREGGGIIGQIRWGERDRKKHKIKNTFGATIAAASCNTSTGKPNTLLTVCRYLRFIVYVYA